MVVARALARSGWTGWRLLGAIGILAAAGAVTGQLWIDLARITLTAPGMSYLPLVPAVIGWMIWVRRRRLRLCRPGGHLAAPVVVLAGGLLYQFGSGAPFAAAGPSALALHAGGWMVIVGSLMAVCWQGIVQFRPAVAALAFALPAPLLVRGGWAGPVHQSVAELSWTLCHMLGVTGGGATGLTIHQISQTIAEVGSGLPLLLALCLVAYAFAFSRPWRWSVRALVLALSPMAAVLCGLVGLTVTAWLLDRLSPGADSLWWISRWGILLAALAALAGLLRVLAWATMPLRLYPRAWLER